jgi:hypothetical protein
LRPGSVISPHIVVCDGSNGASEGDLQAAIQEEQILDGVYNAMQTEDILERRDRQARVREQKERLLAQHFCMPES